MSQSPKHRRAAFSAETTPAPTSASTSASTGTGFSCDDVLADIDAIDAAFDAQHHHHQLTPTPTPTPTPIPTPAATPPAPPAPISAADDGFRLHRRKLIGFQGVPDTEYKPTRRLTPGDLAARAADENWAQVTRREIVGRVASVPDPCGFHLRHFEVAPGGYSSFEKHQHIHAVIIDRGIGEVRIRDAVYLVGPGDVVYIGPLTPHQFRCSADAAQPLSFFCVVDAVRDVPIPVPDTPSPADATPACDSSPQTAAPSPIAATAPKKPAPAKRDPQPSARKKTTSAPRPRKKKSP